MIVSLANAVDEPQFGGKAVQLGSALRAGLPVPSGHAISVEIVDAVARHDRDACARVASLWQTFRGARVACRSSAVGEDSAAASFAGQHLTRLNVASAESLVEGVAEVWRSGRTPAARAYRARLGLDASPKVAAVIQEMVEPTCAGVLFTRNPVTGADERLVEASWGLGEAIVAGLVTPDRYRVRRGGAVVQREIGDKEVMIRGSAAGDTEEVAVDPAQAAAPCLDDAALAVLDALATRCEQAFPGAHDIEWAMAGGTVFLLQRRAVTR